MLRKLLFIFTLAVVVLQAKAVPAYPNKVKVSTENGDTVEITLKGDEFQKYAVSEDGYLLSPIKNSWYYLKKNSDSEYKVSNLQIQKSLSKSISENLVKIDSTIAFSSRKKEMRRRTRQAINGGISHALIVLIEYPDKKFTKSTQEISDLFNKIGYDEDKAQGSVRDFYNYASYGTFDLISDIYGPYMTKSSMEFYGGNQANGDDNNAIEIAIEAINNLPDDIDLSVYDNDDDGTVDNIHIIFAGYGEESGAPSSTIWSHEYPHLLPITKNGYKFAGYSCTPELRSNMGNGISRIGVICHELGHAFGANDFYDVDYTTNGSYEGTGVWDLMASGSWNGNGISPANFNPYIKIEDFGWVIPATPKENGNVLLSSYNFTPSVLRIPTSNPDDYYLLEYRTRESFDRALPETGVLIYHIHPQIESRRKTNTINNRHPQCLYPVCASSNSSPFETSEYGDINSAGCPFPGNTHNTEFSATSTPSCFQWDGNTPNFSIKNISIADDSASFDLCVNNQDSHQYLTEALVYEESFENGLGRFFKESIEGDAEWTIYPTNSLSTINDAPKPYEGKKALMLYDGNKATIRSKSLLTSEGIILNPDSLYTLSFWMRTKDSQASFNHNLSLSIKNIENDKWEKIYENSESMSEWSEIKLALPVVQSALYFQFSGEVLNSGVFIDNIKISNISSADSKQVNAMAANITVSNNPLRITANTFTNIHIIDLSGKIICRYNIASGMTVIPQLPKGIYIICTDNGERYKVAI